jgi:hypothetical protein
MEKRNDKQINNLFTTIFGKIFNTLPNPNSIQGIIFYSFLMYIGFILSIYVSKWLNKHNEKYLEQEQKEFEARLAEYRKARDIEARKLLKRLY